LDLLRIREVKRDLMERVYRLNKVDPPPRFGFRFAEIRYLISQLLDRPMRWPQRVNPSGPMPSGRDEQAAGAMRRALPDLRKLDRYERRASTGFGQTREDREAWSLRNSERRLARQAIELRMDKCPGKSARMHIQSKVVIWDGTFTESGCSDVVTCKFAKRTQFSRLSSMICC
jgi:hypothetical protein